MNRALSALPPWKNTRPVASPERNETRYELDDFPRERRVPANATIEDLRRDLEDLKSLGR